MNGFSLSRWLGILIKEFIQLKRDRLTFGMIIGVPILQLLLFGFAINSDPRHLPTAVVMADPGPFARAYVAAMANSDYFKIVGSVDEREAGRLLDQGAVQFVVTFPPGFHRDLVRGKPPTLLVEADATDPMAASGAISVLNQLGARVFAPDLPGLQRTPMPPVDLRVHRRYNPEGLTAYNIVPGLMGVILTMTMVLLTGLAMTRRARARHLREPALHPGHGHRGDDRQDRALHPDRPDPGHADPAGGALDLRRADARQPAAALRRGAALASARTSHWASPSARWRAKPAAGHADDLLLPAVDAAVGLHVPFCGMPEWAQMVGSVLPLTHFSRAGARHHAQGQRPGHGLGAGLANPVVHRRRARRWAEDLPAHARLSAGGHDRKPCHRPPKTLSY
jgi:ABC-2 type transport system permease protein